MKNKIYLRRKNKIILNMGSAVSPNTSHIATIIKNIENLGYTFSKELIMVLFTYTIEELERFYLGTVKKLKKMVGADVCYTPMYPNFPKQVMDMERSELYINAIIHYWSFGSLLPDYEKEERLPLFENTKLKVIDIGTEDDFFEIFKNLLGSKTSISDTDKMDIEWFVENYKDNIVSMLPYEIPLKENIALIVKLLLDKTSVGSLALSKYFKTATDVLRLAVALSEGDISLAQNTKFKSFKRRERRMLLGFLNNCNNIEEDMLRYKNQWIRLGERLHPSEFKTYLKAQEAFNKIRNGEKIDTYNGKVVQAIELKDYRTAVSLLKQRPGEFARKLDHILRISKDVDFVLNEFESIANQVATPILLQVMEHFKCRNSVVDIRTFFPKGSVAKVYGIQNTLPELDYAICKSVVTICENALIEVYGNKEKLGKVYIDEKLRDYLVPFSQRSASKALKTIVRGSKIDIPYDAKTIRSFIYWKDTKQGRTDIDLSAVLYNKDWKYIEHISYTNLRSAKYKAAHSGDITSAPNGASEFIDLDIESMKKYGVRYVVLSLNSFTQQPYVELPECFMGWMTRKNPNSGEIYEPKTVQNKVDITADAIICIPMILDLYENKVIWADISLKAQPNWNNLESNKKGMVLMGKALTNLVKPNLYDLFQLHVIARGEYCDNVEEADSVFSLDKGVTPFDTDVIISKYL